MIKNNPHIKRIRILTKLNEFKNSINNDISNHKEDYNLNHDSPKTNEEQADLFIPSIINHTLIKSNIKPSISISTYFQKKISTIKLKNHKLHLKHSPTKSKKYFTNRFLSNSTTKNRKKITKIENFRSKLNFSTIKIKKNNLKNKFNIIESSIITNNKNHSHRNIPPKKILINNGFVKNFKNDDIYQGKKIFIYQNFCDKPKYVFFNDNIQDFSINNFLFKNKINFYNKQKKYLEKKLTLINKKYINRLIEGKKDYVNNDKCIKTKNSINSSFSYVDNFLLKKSKFMNTDILLNKKYHNNIKIKTFMDLSCKKE